MLHRLPAAERHPHRQAVLARLDDGFGHLVGGAGRQRPARLGRLVASPVPPGRGDTGHAGTLSRLAAAGLYGHDGQLRNAAMEEDIYAALGLPCIPPEIRSGDDEIDVIHVFDHGIAA